MFSVGSPKEKCWENCDSVNSEILGDNSGIRFRNENTPCVGAVNNDSFDAVKTLARKGGDVSTPPPGYSNIMDYARELGFHHIANWLLEFGAL